MELLAEESCRRFRVVPGKVLVIRVEVMYMFNNN